MYHCSSLTCQKFVLYEKEIYAQGIFVGLCPGICIVSFEFKPHDKGIVNGLALAQINTGIGHTAMI